MYMQVYVYIYVYICIQKYVYMCKYTKVGSDTCTFGFERYFQSVHTYLYVPNHLYQTYTAHTSTPLVHSMNV